MSDWGYYNEIDEYPAQWIRNLIAKGLIAPGVVDTRSILDVHPDDLREFTQCHFFAGIAVWSYALRRAGWPDSRPVWTGSCPCQPFSAAGEGLGFTDERHLWPHFFYLIDKRRPPVVTGEQVASKDADTWLDLVQSDLEAVDYAFGAVPFPSAGVGAPHWRDRIYWMAHANHAGLEGRGRVPECPDKRITGARSMVSGLANANGVFSGQGSAIFGGGVSRSDAQPWAGLGSSSSSIDDRRPGPINGFWRDADWVFCRDGKWRPVEPGSQPLVNGLASGMGRVCADQERITALPSRKDQGSRAGRLKGYGNAINAEQALVFIQCMQEILDCRP